jgi:gas vesicle protein GvpO
VTATQGRSSSARSRTAAKKTPTKKTATKKTAAKKTAAKKAPTKKSAAKKSAAREATEKSPGHNSRSEPEPLRVASRAAEQLVALTGREPEGVAGLERTEDGWIVQVELLELRRVPSTTDVIALYEVRTDERGDLQGYRRLRRYARGSADDE